MLYFDTNSINGSTSSIFRYSLSAANDGAGGAGSYSTVWTQTSAAPGQLLDLVIDPQTSGNSDARPRCRTIAMSA